MLEVKKEMSQHHGHRKKSISNQFKFILQVGIGRINILDDIEFKYIRWQSSQE